MVGGLGLQSRQFAQARQIGAPAGVVRPADKALQQGCVTVLERSVCSGAALLRCLPEAEDEIDCARLADGGRQASGQGHNPLRLVMRRQSSSRLQLGQPI